ncbi:hypothetical protein M0805_004178 [Coniferiporia weirii]|nr:hypothetical protein M0805_004178 [Coniferiporia weirii]
MTTTTPTKPLKRLSLLQSPTSTTFVSPPSSNLCSPIVAPERIITPGRFDDANATGSVRPQSSSTCQPSPVANAHPPSGSKSARRQSSIYYVPSDRGFERVAQGLDSPVNARRFSALQMPAGNAKPQEDKDRRDVSLADSSAAPATSLTLAERHADLLRFIAQKESKCLELRSQLATHEAELLALKRKWERIVSRGLGGGPSASLSSFDADASPQAAVFTGIREGMQGMGRLLAQIGDLSSQGADMNNASTESGHMSNSSVSTTLTSSSTRLSQSSISSLGVPDDEASEKCEELPRDVQTTRREPFSISTVVRRKPYEPSSPLDPPSSLSTPKSPIFTPSPKIASSSPMSRLHSAPPTLTKHRERHSAMQGAFPPASSIPGMSAGAPLASWVDSVGKKLGQIHAQVGAPGAGAQPIHKRASTLLSDASYSLFAALASPTRPAAPSYAGEQKLPLSAKSLLDDDDDDALGQWTGMAALSPDLPKAAPARTVPSIIAAPVSSSVVSQDYGQKSSDADSDEWNW